jgi:hypothetical protein
MSRPRTSVEYDSPRAASSDADPDPVPARATTPAARLSGNSTPPLRLQKPFGRWTSPTITTDWATSAAVARGVSNPKASRPPPPSSAAVETIAQARAGPTATIVPWCGRCLRKTEQSGLWSSSSDATLASAPDALIARTKRPARKGGLCSSASRWEALPVPLRTGICGQLRIHVGPTRANSGDQPGRHGAGGPSAHRPTRSPTDALSQRRDRPCLPLGTRSVHGGLSGETTYGDP